MRFESPWFLILIFLAPIFWKKWLKNATPAAFLFSLPIVEEPRASSWGPEKVTVFFKTIAYICLVLAMARPQSSAKQQERKVTGIDIMLVLDVSASMLAEDLADRSRLDIAKSTIEKFVRSRQNDRLGFVMFAGEALTLAPLTLDYPMLLAQIKQVDIGVLKDGTAIGDGLSTAVAGLKESNAKTKIVVLLTDGDNNLGVIDPSTAGEIARGYGIKVYTIAAGKEGRVKLPIRHRTPFGNTVTTYQWQDNALNTELLENIAAHTGGRFYRVQDEKTLEEVYSEIDKLEKSDQNAKEKVKYDEQFQKFVILSVVFLVLDQVFLRTRLRTLT